jgi:hypothetical protein
MEPVKRSTESPRRLLLLLGLAVVLAGALLWDWRGDGSGERAPNAPARPPKAVAANVAADRGASAEDGRMGEDRGPNPLASLALDQLRDTVRRPLFEKGRRPVEPPPRTAAVPAPPAPVPRKTVDTNALTLLGILKSEDQSAIALVKRNQTGQNLRLQEGDTVDGWTIDRIEADRVFLRQGDTRIALQLFRKR